MIYSRLFLLFLLILILSPFSDAQVESEEVLSGYNVTGISGDGTDVWVATYGGGIYRIDYKNKKFTSYSTQNGNIPEDFFYCIAASIDYVWAGTSSGLLVLDREDGKWKKRKFSSGGDYGNWVKTLHYDENRGLLWIGRFINLSILDVKRQKYSDYELTRGKDPRSNNINVIKPEGKDRIWIGTESGAFIYSYASGAFNPSELEYINNQNRGFNGDGEFVSVSDFVFDNNFVWFGTQEFVSKEKPSFNLGGLYKFNKRASWERIDRTKGLPGNGIYRMVKTGNYIWLGVYEFNKDNKEEYGRGFAIVDRVTGQVLKINYDEFFPGTNTIKSLFYDGNNLWMGTDKGLWRLRISNDLAFWQKKKSK
ncbi:MAG: hypothetical protein L6Q59_02650 [Ignavibacteriaceae bacterium]|nr:hypothetical protein [Ignavibacteriaceae bacterium]